MCVCLCFPGLQLLKYLTCYSFALEWLFTCAVCGALVLGSVPSLGIYTQTLLCVPVHDFIALEFVVLVYGKDENPGLVHWSLSCVCLVKTSMSSFFQVLES